MIVEITCEIPEGVAWSLARQAVCSEDFPFVRGERLLPRTENVSDAATASPQHCLTHRR